MLFMTLNLTISLFISFCLFIYLFIYFLVKKSNNLLTVNKNLKQETIIVFVKFANCDNWIFSPESPVENYVHFQAFTSVSFAKTFICRIMSQKKQSTIKLTVNQILQILHKYNNNQLMKNKNNNNKRLNTHWEWRRRKKLKLVACGTQVFLKHNPALISLSFNFNYLKLSYKK